MSKQAKSEYSLACPNCGSREIEYASLRTDAPRAFVGLGLPEVYYCPACGFEGPAIEVGLGKVHFQHKRYEQVAPQVDKGSLELVKPAFTIAVLVFFVFTAFFFFNGPKVPFEQPTTNTNVLGSTAIGSGFFGLTGDKITATASLPAIAPPRIVDTLYTITLATGLGGLAGFTFSLLLMAFMAAFIALVVGHHYQRALHFL